MNLASCRDPEDAGTKRVLLSVAVFLLTFSTLDDPASSGGTV
ncbi:MAG: hypothetical protein O7A98_09420 [Acidobacteria bacterium]|nr:hypothetical protein [Acidobacteriota bacterium]